MQIILDLGASFLKGYVVEGQLDNIVETFETPGLAKKQINLSDASFPRSVLFKCAKGS